MDYIKLYRTIDRIEKEQIDHNDCLSYDKYIIKSPKDFNTFDYKAKRKHFYFDLPSTYLYSKIKYGDNPYIYSFDMPLDLCINNVGAGRYNLGGVDYYILECGIPFSEIIKYTKDYKAFIPLLRAYRYFDNSANLYVKKLIKINNAFQCEECYDVPSDIIDEFESNDFAESIYKQSANFGYSYDVPKDQVYEYLEDKKLILHK